MKNVLLLCLSPLNPMARRNTYSCQLKGETAFFEGIMTNEAPTKFIIERFNRVSQNNRLDRIVMICSDAVKKQVVLSENNTQLKNTDTVCGKRFEEFSHIELYKALINSFAEKTDKRYIEEPIEYIEVPIPDFTNDFQVSNSVINAANEITSLEDNINLHIDFNGGQRYVAFMILSIANLMKIRGVTVNRIMTMNFDNKIDGIVPIQNMLPLFESFDLISGINEYINYGRIKGLSKYFSSAGEEVKAILREMKVFSDNLQLCRTDYVMQHKSELYQRLVNYLESNNGEQHKDTYNSLFGFVVKDILAGYNGLLNGTLPEIISWCVERDFIQQALTFCSEEMPNYFWEQKIFTPSEKELEEYNNFVDTVVGSENVSSKLRDFKKAPIDCGSRYTYNWMIKYLPFSAEEEDYQRILSENDAEENELMLISPDIKNDLFEIKNSIFQMSAFKNKRIRNINRFIKKNSTAIAKLIWQLEHEPCRVSTVITDRGLLKEILTVYFLLKDQRNQTNHANGGAGCDDWDYNELCFALKWFAKMLSEL